MVTAIAARHLALSLPEAEEKKTIFICPTFGSRIKYSHQYTKIKNLVMVKLNAIDQSVFLLL
jgi:hypothetical protein